MPSIVEYAQSLANHFPGGKLFKAKNVSGSNLQNLIAGSAEEFKKAGDYLLDFVNNTIPNNPQLLLEEWESAVGIPDSCLPGTGTVEERIIHILVKLASLGIQTEQDFIDLAAVFGYTVTVTNGFDDGDASLTGMFTIIITFSISPATFTLTFPILFGTEGQTIAACLFTNLKPANCRIIFR